mgnify:CR=1 FL=1|tara:strand:+ start:970 stop:1305 length:336 start_codon:yes stop_codon:yes gene_type:complete
MKKKNQSARKDAAYKALREEKDEDEAYKAGFRTDYSRVKADRSFDTGADRAKRFSKIKGAKTHKGVKMVPARDQPALRATEPTKPRIKTMSGKKRDLAELERLRRKARKKK